MEFFPNAQLVRLRSHQGSYLYADDGRVAVSHGYRGNSRSTVWAVERVAGDYVRLVGAHGLYLGATEIPAQLDGGNTSCKVYQGVPATPNDNAFLWSPRREGHRFTLSGPFGRLLRANFGPAPQDNTVTVDFGAPGVDWSFWLAEAVAPAEAAPPRAAQPYDSRVKAGLHALFPLRKVVPISANISSASTQPVDTPGEETLRRLEPRIIFYNIARDDGGVDGFDDGTWKYFTFSERSLTTLRRRLEEESGRTGVIVCRQSKEGRLFPVVLDLPPGNGDMEFVLVLELSRVAKGLKWPQGPGSK